MRPLSVAAVNEWVGSHPWRFLALFLAAMLVQALTGVLDVAG